jgi:uncharacterized protein
MTHIQELNQELIDTFVGLSHNNLPKVKELLAQHPELLPAEASGDGETAVAAAAHVGSKDIVEYLLAQGAKLDICTAAMMGWRDKVAQFLADDPTQVHAKGAHDITLIFHAALSGDTELADMILAHGGGEGLEYALHGAVKFGHLAMTRWFLQHDPDLTILDFRDRTPLEVAVESGFTDIVALLRQHMGEEALDTCSQCQKYGYRFVSKIEGKRWEAHTTHYACKNCGAAMGQVYHEKGGSILSGK